MKKITWIALALIILGLVVGSFTYLYVFREADTNVASKKPDFIIQAAKLLKEFTNDENAANAKYIDKVILVKGMVDKVSTDSASVSVYLMSPDNVSGIQCGFDIKAIDLASIKQGDSIKVKGICTGYLMDVVLNKCSIEK